MLVGIAGQIAAGKDELSNYLVAKLGLDWHRVAFATGLKTVMADAFGVSLAFMEEWKRKDEIPTDYLMTVRESLQLIGEFFRKIKPTVWIDLALKGNSSKIISDVRYINEAKAIKKRGGINVLLYRPGFENNINHPSESQLKPYIDLCLKSGQEGILDWERFCCRCGKQLVAQNSWMDGGCPCNSCDTNISELFDVFLINDGTLEDLCEKADKLIIPFVEKNYE